MAERIGKSSQGRVREMGGTQVSLNESVGFHLAETLDVCSILIGNKVGEESLEYKLGKVFECMAAK